MTNSVTTLRSLIQPQMNTLKYHKDKQISPCRWCYPYASIWEALLGLFYFCRSKAVEKLIYQEATGSEGLRKQMHPGHM